MFTKRMIIAVSLFCLAACLIAIGAGAAEGQAGNDAAASPTPTPDLAAKYRIRFDGFGPVKIGMKPSEAMKVFALTENRWDDESDCYYLDLSADEPETLPSFMVNEGTVARVDVSVPGYLTEAGAKLGDTEARIKELYGKGVEISPHEYVDGHYLTVKSKDGKYAIVFETDGRVVTYIRAGRLPEAGYIEGCA